MISRAGVRFLNGCGRWAAVPESTPSSGQLQADDGPVPAAVVPVVAVREPVGTDIAVGLDFPHHMVPDGGPGLVVSKILNHVETGVTAVYDRHSYDIEKRAALDYWGKRVDDMVHGRRGKLLRFSLSA